MLLDYLVTSKTKKDLLRLFVVEVVEGTAQELTLLCEGTYSCVFDELKEMEKLGLLEKRNSGNKKVYRLNNNSSHSSELFKLFGLSKEDLQRKKEEQQLRENKDVVKSHLSFFGAPVLSGYRKRCSCFKI